MRAQALPSGGKQTLPQEMIYREAFFDDATFTVWRVNLAGTPVMMTYRLVEYIEVGLKNLSKVCQQFLRLLMAQEDDLIAVHSYRALCRTGVLTSEELEEIIGYKRHNKWVRLGWNKASYSGIPSR